MPGVGEDAGEFEIVDALVSVPVGRDGKSFFERGVWVVTVDDLS